MLDDFQLDSLTEQIGSTFEVLQEGNKIISLLLEKIDIVVNSVQHQNFSLLFRGPVHPLLLQGIQTIVHPVFGISDIFLVPIASDANGIVYEAVFNRVR